MRPRRFNLAHDERLAALGRHAVEADEGLVAVDGTGSKWSVVGSLDVGSSGVGSLTLSGGATVTSSTTYLGHYASSSGMAIISGSGSTWTPGYLAIGGQGIGTMSIVSGGAGAAFSILLLTYTASSVASTVFITAGMFAGKSVRLRHQAQPRFRWILLHDGSLGPERCRDLLIRLPEGPFLNRAAAT